MTTNLLNGAMLRSLPWVDRFAISLSTLCIVHCFLTPLYLLALPSLFGTVIGNEAFHSWLVYAVIPSSFYALGMGCKQHKRGLFIAIGSFGLGFLVLGIFTESVGLRHAWEQVFTVLGAALIAVAHVRNFQQCRKSLDLRL